MSFLLLVLSLAACWPPGVVSNHIAVGAASTSTSVSSRPAEKAVAHELDSLLQIIKIRQEMDVESQGELVSSDIDRNSVATGTASANEPEPKYVARAQDFVELSSHAVVEADSKVLDGLGRNADLAKTAERHAEESVSHDEISAIADEKNALVTDAKNKEDVIDSLATNELLVRTASNYLQQAFDSLIDTYNSSDDGADVVDSSRSEEAKMVALGTDSNSSLRNSNGTFAGASIAGTHSEKDDPNSASVVSHARNSIDESNTAVADKRLSLALLAPVMESAFLPLCIIGQLFVFGCCCRALVPPLPAK